VWDVNNPVPQLAELTGSGGATADDLAYNPNGALAAQTTSAGTDDATSNWLGSVTGLTSTGGTQVSSTTYTPYGAPTTTGSPAPVLGFAGAGQSLDLLPPALVAGVEAHGGFTETQTTTALSFNIMDLWPLINRFITG
jgi:hypothetical protein